MTEYLKNLDGSINLPMSMAQKEIAFDDDTKEKMDYLKAIKGQGNYSNICNKAVKEFLAEKFIELKLEHYSDPEFEQRVNFNLKKQEIQIKKRDNARLVELAKRNILEREVERLRAEEKRTGKKLTLKIQYPPVEVELLYPRVIEGKQFDTGQKVTIPRDYAERLDNMNLVKIIKKEKGK